MPNIHGVNDKKSGDDDQDEKSYVGGADGRGGGSGLNVIEPPNGGRGGNDPYAAMKAAAEQAGGGADDSSGSGASGGGRTITLYSNGFRVDDGPFRALSDPANADFVAFMNRGQVPPELREGSPEDMNVKLVDKSSEEYVPPPPPAYVAYSGDGQVAGGASTVAEGALAGGGSAQASEAPVVDESQPKATIAVRLSTGKRFKAVLNLTHTVAHLHALIGAHDAAAVAQPYVLSAGFPPAQLADPSATIEAAGLAGAQVTQKLV